MYTNQSSIQKNCKLEKLYLPDMPMAILLSNFTTNTEGICLAEDEFIAKTYSENEGVNEQFLGSCFEDTGKTTITGFVEVPIYRFIGLEEYKV